MTETLPSIAPLAALSAACLAAAYLDVRYRRIPNWLSAITALGGLLSAVLLEGLGTLYPHALHLVVALTGGMILFRFNAVGGGDAKYYAAVAGWFPLSSGVLLLILVTLSGLVVLFGWFAYRRLAGYPIRVKSGTVFDGLPYGIAIGLGAVGTMTTSAL